MPPPGQANSAESDPSRTKRKSNWRKADGAPVRRCPFEPDVNRRGVWEKASDFCPTTARLRFPLPRPTPTKLGQAGGSPQEATAHERRDPAPPPQSSKHFVLTPTVRRVPKRNCSLKND